MKTLLVLKVSCCRCLAHTQKTSPYIRICSELITTTETNKLQISVACDKVRQLEAANWQKGKGMCFRGVLDHFNTTSTSDCTVPTINKNIETFTLLAGKVTQLDHYYYFNVLCTTFALSLGIEYNLFISHRLYIAFPVRGEMITDQILFCRRTERTL